MTIHDHSRRPPDFQASDSHLDALTMRIVEAAGLELSRRRQDDSLWYVLAQWTKPVLAAAAVLVVISAAVLGFQSAGVSDLESFTPTVAEALIPEEMAPWYYDGNDLTLAEMVLALEGGSR